MSSYNQFAVSILSGRGAGLPDPRLVKKSYILRSSVKNVCLPRIEYTSDANYFRLRSSKWEYKKSVQHKRGKIKGFSFRSRSRMMQKLSQVKRGHLPYFVTLTFGEIYPTDKKAYKYLLHLFLNRVQNKYKNAGIIWKLEYQKRGAPHYHLFIYGCDETLADFVPEVWYELAGYENENHLRFHRGELPRSQHCVQQIKSIHGVFFYASKYMTKLEKNEIADTGRIWGVVGSVPFAEVKTYMISLDVALQLRRSYLMILKSKPAVRWSSALKRKLFLKNFGFSCITSDNWFRYAFQLQNNNDLVDENIPPLRYGTADIMRLEKMYENSIF